MTRDELIELLHRHEWRDVEFKEAQRGVPRDAYESVSAFANTEGGHLVFGVRKSGQDMEIVGVLDVDKVQSEFLSTLRQPDKLSVVVDVKEELHRHGGSDLLVFHVAEAHRSQKPVFLNGNINRSFVRSGGSDVRCSEQERNRFLLDASTERPDGQVVDLDLRTAFDADAVRWYRAAYEARPDNRSCKELSDTDFLAEMGLIVERGGERRPTRAAILLFGANRTFRQLLPRPVVDCQRFMTTRVAADTGDRWFDRVVLDENLVRAWRFLIEDWYQKIADHPFRIDPATMQRDDTPPDYRAFRESLINLVMHQDYADHSRHAVIRHYRDQTVFWNPGDAFAADPHLLEPGEREARNPRIVLAFRRIGLSEHAGWGLRDVFRNWQELGYVPPRIVSDRRRKGFELVLTKETLISDSQRAWQQSLGMGLMDEEARAFALACRGPDIKLWQVKAVTGLSGPEAAALADRLVNRGLIERAGTDRFVLAEQIRGRLPRSDQVSDQVLPWHSTGTDHVHPQQPDMVTGHVRRPRPDMVTDHVRPAPPEMVTDHAPASMTAHQRGIVDACDVPRSLLDLMQRAGVRHRTFFRRKHMQPLLDAGIIRMTNPGRQNAADQRYVLTETGVALKAARIAAVGEGAGRGEGADRDRVTAGRGPGMG